MSREVVYKCNTCGQEIETGSMYLRVVIGAGVFKCSDWDHQGCDNAHSELHFHRTCDPKEGIGRFLAANFYNEEQHASDSVG